MSKAAGNSACIGALLHLNRTPQAQWQVRGRAVPRPTDLSWTHPWQRLSPTCRGLTLDKGFHPIHQCLLYLQWAKLWFLDWGQEFAPVALSHNQGLTNEQSACLSIFLPHNSFMRSVLLPFQFPRWEKLRQKLSASHKWTKLLCINTQGSNFHPLLACPELSTCFQSTQS